MSIRCFFLVSCCIAALSKIGKENLIPLRSPLRVKRKNERIKHFTSRIICRIIYICKYYLFTNIINQLHAISRTQQINLNTILI